MGEGDLASFVEDVCGEGHLRVETDLGGGFVRLRSSEAERRQAAQDIRSTEDIIIEMLRNARDAHASNIFVACTREGSCRRIVMLDDGDGVPESMQHLIFEPRVTSKLDTMHMDKWGVHGRGMALYSIAVNAVSACIVASEQGLGSSFVIETDLQKLPEKTDQSTFPSFELTDSGSVSVRGPKNILRSTCEFAIESRGSVNVFIGSATDIAATLYAYGLKHVTAESRAASGAKRGIPVCDRLAACADVQTFHMVAESLGLIMSQRSARRIMDGQISPEPPILSKIDIQGLPAPEPADSPVGKNLPRVKKAKGLRLSEQDLHSFEQQVQRAYRDIARDYYLEPEITPQVKISKDAIHITIPVVMQS